MKTELPPSVIGHEGIRPCGRNERSLKAIKNVGEGVSSGELMAFHHDKDITHVEAPSSTTILFTKRLLQTDQTDQPVRKCRTDRVDAFVGVEENYS
jgi:hypothetical protein